MYSIQLTKVTFNHRSSPLRLKRRYVQANVHCKSYPTSKVTSKPERKANGSPRYVLRMRRFPMCVRIVPESIPSQHRRGDPEPASIVYKLSRLHRLCPPHKFISIHTHIRFTITLTLRRNFI